MNVVMNVVMNIVINMLYYIGLLCLFGLFVVIVMYWKPIPNKKYKTRLELQNPYLYYKYGFEY